VPISVPRTMMTPGVVEDLIPGEMARRLREGLRDIFPALADKEFFKTRLCWWVLVGL
jgi:hypothetical protein